MIIESLQNLALPIDSLRALPGNPRVGDVDAVAASLEKFGQRKPIVVRKDDGTIIAGNHTWQAAQKLGWKEIAVAFVGDDDTTAQAYALADNRTAELGSYDEQALKDLIDKVAAVDPELVRISGWSDDAVQELLDKIEAAQPKEPKADVMPDVPIIPISKLGDMWQIGKHKILCGDSSDIKNLEHLIQGEQIECVLTDPPYGINLDTDYSAGGGKKYRPVLGDDSPFDASFYVNYFNTCAEQFWFGANYYQRTILENDLSGSWLVWDKRTEATDVVIGSSFELCWSRTKHKQDLLRYHWTNFVSNTNAGEQRAHPTEKPITMLEEILNRWCKQGAIVIDPFAGSGSGLIAAARTGRIGFGIEFDAAYVDVIVKRLENITGEKAVLLNAESSKAN